jgi:hypothetical protein
MIDTSTPVPGPWRMPTDAEPRTQVQLMYPWRDCTSVCAVNPDLEERNDATMRQICAAPEAVRLCRDLLAGHTATYDDVAEQFHRDTGFMAPGKDQPAAMGGYPTIDERRAAWYAWRDKRDALITTRLQRVVHIADHGHDGHVPHLPES